MSASSNAYRDTAGITWIAMRLLHNNLQLEINKVNDTINVEQLFLLMELDSEDGLRPSVLAKRMVRSKGTLSSLIRHAKRNEYIAVTDDPKNKNAKRVFLTIYGKKIHDQLKPIIADTVANAMSHVAPENLTIVDQAMSGIIKTFSPELFDLEVKEKKQA
ncbi:MarR family winged helix-turn-helix transcriptional regulator [Psychromonas ossibalaenae]|uniref:MarR family winged helix-turn-helix transcriptional regulator n=1 Tax=Psychromonas ossibalaenae TaxID=444922 RepID=UPI00037AE9F3|nr:MarR family transcriptional regulator [Psychromonas ossibalaenae]